MDGGAPHARAFECLSCGWEGKASELGRHEACPDCGGRMTVEIDEPEDDSGLE